jgi:catalase
MDGAKVRQRSPSFADHFSQATLFWNSMADWEKEHIAQAFSFELNMVETYAVKERFLNEILANIHDDLAKIVSKNIGVPLKRRSVTGITPEASAPAPRNNGKRSVKVSPALSMDIPRLSVKGYKVAILAADGVDAKQVADLKAALAAEGALADVIARYPGTIKGSNGKEVQVDKPAANAASVLYDAVFVPGGRSADTLAQSTLAVQFVAEAFMHGKAVGALEDGIKVLSRAQIQLPGAANGKGVSTARGVVTATGGKDQSAFNNEFIQAMTRRHHDRQTEKLPD